jgi:hypothetical protein
MSKIKLRGEIPLTPTPKGPKPGFVIRPQTPEDKAVFAEWRKGNFEPQPK